MVTDQIANALTNIRNAVNVKKKEVSLVVNNEIIEILKILKDGGYIEDFGINEETKKADVKLKNNKAIFEIKRLSKPGRRVYSKSCDIPKIYNGLGTVIVSTSKGIMTGRSAQREKVGGELLCSIF